MDLEDALEEEPKKKVKLQAGEATRVEIQKASPSKSSVAMQDNLTGPRCPKCDQVCKDQNNLKNHVLSNYYEDFYRVTLDTKPFACPTCGKEHRDRITNGDSPWSGTSPSSTTCSTSSRTSCQRC